MRKNDSAISKERNTGFQLQRLEQMEYLANYIETTDNGEGIEHVRVLGILIKRYGFNSKRANAFIDDMVLGWGFEKRNGRVFKNKIVVGD